MVDVQLRQFCRYRQCLIANHRYHVRILGIEYRTAQSSSVKLYFWKLLVFESFHQDQVKAHLIQVFHHGL